MLRRFLLSLVVLAALLAPGAGASPVIDGYRYSSSVACAPTDLANLALWLDAADPATITASGGSVSQWNDKSGLGYHGTQGTGAAQPKTGTRTINGVNVIDFDGNDVLRNTTATSGAAQPTTYFFVARFDSNSSTHRRLYNSKTAGGNEQMFWVKNGGSNFGLYGGSDATTTISYDSNPHVFLVVFSGASSALYKDGGTVSTVNAGTGVGRKGYALGADETGTFEFFDGAVAEIAKYEGSLTTSDKNYMGNCLSTKWGLTWTTIP